MSKTTSIVSAADFETSRKKGCACGHIVCVCNVIDRHKPDCRFRKAVTCPVGIECPHGRDVCPICDPCECGTANEKGQP